MNPCALCGKEVKDMPWRCTHVECWDEREPSVPTEWEAEGFYMLDPDESTDVIKVVNGVEYTRHRT